MITSYYKLGRS